MARRRPGLLLLAAALVIGGVWALWPRPAPRAPLTAARPGSPVVVFLGDSITSGHRLPADVAFPSRLGQALGIPVINAGISGDTTEGGLSRLDRDVLAHHPQVVVVELGVNDVFAGWPRERTVANLRTTVQRIRATGARVILLHISLPTMPGDGHRQQLRETAQDGGATLVEDFLDGVVPQYSYDGLHPDEKGQAMLADRLLPVLRQVLEP